MKKLAKKLQKDANNIPSDDQVAVFDLEPAEEPSDLYTIEDERASLAPQLDSTGDTVPDAAADHVTEVAVHTDADCDPVDDSVPGAFTDLIAEATVLVYADMAFRVYLGVTVLTNPQLVVNNTDPDTSATDGVQDHQEKWIPVAQPREEDNARMTRSGSEPMLTEIATDDPVWLARNHQRFKRRRWELAANPSFLSTLDKTMELKRQQQ